MRRLLYTLAIASAVIAAATGCGAYKASNLTPHLTTTATMQLAVGTLNDSAGSIAAVFTSKTGSPPATTLATYLSAVATFRNQDGLSAFQEPGEASLTGPGSISVDAGQLSSYGDYPFSALVVGQPPAYTPAANNFVGYPTGFIFTDVAPAAGGYTIATTVTANSQNYNYSATAALPGGFTVLGNEPTPSYSGDGAGGGGTFTIGQPAGITESVIVIFTVGSSASCSPLGGQAATVETTSTTALVPDGTLAQGTQYCAFVLGADYPLVEDGPPTNTQVTPGLTGAGGTADLTASGIVAFTQ